MFFVELLAFLNKFSYFWLHWVLVAAHGLSAVEAAGLFCIVMCGVSSRCLLLLQSADSGVGVHGLSCFEVSGILPGHVLNLCPLC